MDVAKRDQALAGINDLQSKIGRWAARTFPGTRAGRMVGSSNHLKLEAQELCDSISDLVHAQTASVADERWEKVKAEAADILILLFNVAHFADFSLAEAVMAKHDINLTRTWKAPDKDGVIEHVKEDKPHEYRASNA